MSLLQMRKPKPEVQSSLGLPEFRSFSLLQSRTHCLVRNRPAVVDAAGVSVLSAGPQASHRARWPCQLCPIDVYHGIEGSQRPCTLLPSLHPPLHPPVHPSISTADQMPTPLLTPTHLPPFPPHLSIPLPLSMPSSIH